MNPKPLFSSCLQWLRRWWRHTPLSEMAISDLLKEAANNSIIGPETLFMMENIMQFSKLKVRDVMLPKHEMVYLRNNDTPKTVLEKVTDSGHSRFPVMDEKGEIIGILHAKDLLQYDKEEEWDLEDMVRLAICIPESKRLDLLLVEFRTNRNHMALVVDEYGEISGFITIEDIIEQIIGNIEDEFDIDDETFLKLHGNRQYTIKSQMPIDEFNAMLHTNLNNDTYDTIGGLVMAAFGHLPQHGETIMLHDFEFRVISADARRVRLLGCIDKRPLHPENGETRES